MLTRSAHKQNLRYRLWQQSFYDFGVYSEDALVEKLDYIHHNPVRAGLVDSPGDYGWSSYRFHHLEARTLADLQSPVGTHVAGI